MTDHLVGGTHEALNELFLHGLVRLSRDHPADSLVESVNLK